MIINITTHVHMLLKSCHLPQGLGESQCWKKFIKINLFKRIFNQSIFHYGCLNQCHVSKFLQGGNPGLGWRQRRENAGDKYLEEHQSVEQLPLAFCLRATAIRKNIITVAILKGQSLYSEIGSS